MMKQITSSAAGGRRQWKVSRHRQRARRALSGIGASARAITLYTGHLGFQVQHQHLPPFVVRKLVLLLKEPDVKIQKTAASRSSRGNIERSCASPTCKR